MPIFALFVGAHKEKYRLRQNEGNHGTGEDIHKGAFFKIHLITIAFRAAVKIKARIMHGNKFSATGIYNLIVRFLRYFSSAVIARM